MDSIKDKRDKLTALSRQRKAMLKAGKIPRNIDAEAIRLRTAMGSAWDPFMNASRRRALLVLARDPLAESALPVLGMQARTFRALEEIGLAKYRPHGKSPSWAITRDGRALVAKASGSKT